MGKFDECFPLLKERQVAKMLGISVFHLADMRKKGIGPPFSMLGKSPRYIREKVEQWLADGGSKNMPKKGQRKTPMIA